MGEATLRVDGVARVAGVAGLCAPVTLWSSLLVVGALDPGFRLLDYPESDLGMRGAPYAIPFNLFHFVLTGLLLLVFATGVYRLVPPLTRLSGALVGVCAAAFIASGVLPADHGSANAMAVHQAIGSVLLWAMPFAPASLALAVFGCRGGRRLAVLSLAVAAALALIGILVLVLPAAFQLPVGVYQRAWSLVASAWILLAGWTLAGGRGPATRRPGRAPRSELGG